MFPKFSGSVLALALILSHPARPASGEPDLAAIRAATARFQDVRQAISEGYVRGPINLCDSAGTTGEAASLGARDIHYFRQDVVGLRASLKLRAKDSGGYTMPAVLTYEPKGDGSLQLVAVETVVFRWAWREASRSAPRGLQSLPSNTMNDDPMTKVDEANMFEPHYDRKVWIFGENPRGVFAEDNPNLGCAVHTKPSTETA